MAEDENWEEYPEYILNYIAAEVLISEKECELQNLDLDLINHENRLEHLIDMSRKAMEIGKEIRYLDREIDATDNYLLDISIQAQEKTDELEKLQEDMEKYLQEIKEAGWEEIYTCQGDRKSIKWVKKESNETGSNVEEY